MAPRRVLVKKPVDPAKEERQAALSKKIANINAEQQGSPKIRQSQYRNTEPNDPAQEQLSPNKRRVISK